MPVNFGVVFRIRILVVKDGIGGRLVTHAKTSCPAEAWAVDHLDFREPKPG